MTKTITAAIAGVFAVLAAAPAMAATIGFENSPDLPIFSTDPGYDSSYQEAGFTMSVLDSPAGPGGLLGAIIDGSDPNSCTVTACPVGNNSRYFAGLNDGGLGIARADQKAFTLSGLDYAFVGPIVGLPDQKYGKLVLTGQLQGGGTVQAAFDFPSQNAAGDNVFGHLSQLGGLSGVSLTSLTVNACLLGTDNQCFYPASNQAQFGLDNVEVSAVPEPETYAMLLGGLGVMAMLSRRRRAAAASATSTNA
jgi:hypothetical protein